MINNRRNRIAYRRSLMENRADWKNHSTIDTLDGINAEVKNIKASCNTIEKLLNKLYRFESKYGRGTTNYQDMQYDFDLMKRQLTHLAEDVYEVTSTCDANWPDFDSSKADK